MNKTTIAMFMAFEGALSEAIDRGDISFAAAEPFLDYAQDAFKRIVNGETVEPKSFPPLGYNTDAFVTSDAMIQSLFAEPKPAYTEQGGYNE